MSAKFNSRHIASLYSVSAQTIRAWADEFQDYFSVNATPGNRQHRQFTEDDLEIFSLIKHMKNNGAHFEAIHAALAAGQRGERPALPSDDLIDVVASPAGLALLNQVRALAGYVQRLEQRIENLETGESDKLRAELTEAYKQIGRLEVLLEIEKAKNTFNE